MSHCKVPQCEDDHPVMFSNFVAEPNPHDVLLGRGARSVTHSGNVRFRSLVYEKFTEYTTTGCHIDKELIARRIVSTIESDGGCFLTKLTTAEERKAHDVPESTVDAWLPESNKSKVLEKVKQAFRSYDSLQNKAKKKKEILANTEMAKKAKASLEPEQQNSAQESPHSTRETTDLARAYISQRPRASQWSPLAAERSSLLQEETALLQLRRIRQQDELERQRQENIFSQSYQFRSSQLGFPSSLYSSIAGRNLDMIRPIQLGSSVGPRFTRDDMLFTLQLKADAEATGNLARLKQIRRDLRGVLASSNNYDLGLEDVIVLTRTLQRMESALEY